MFANFFQICYSLFNIINKGIFMNLFYQFLTSISLMAENDVTSPLYKALGIIGPVAISVALACSLIYSIVLGVQYSKSESVDERKAAQKKLISFVIGAVVICGLIVILYALRAPLSDWANKV